MEEAEGREGRKGERAGDEVKEDQFRTITGP